MFFLLLIQVNLGLFCKDVNPNLEGLYTFPVPPFAKSNAVYGEWKNPYPSDVSIQSIQSNRYQKLELHDSVTDDFGVVRMHRRDFPILVKKGAAFKLVKGGRHLMLYEKKQEATEKHILILELGSKQRIEIDVEERNR